MSVEYIRLRASRTFSVNDTGEQGAERTYIAKTTDKNDGPEAVLAHADAPQIGESFSAALPSLVAADVSCDEVEGGAGIVFELKAKYSNKTEDPEQTDPNTPPTERPIRVSMSFDSFEEALYKSQGIPQAVDVDDAAVNIATHWRWSKAVVNSAGKAFDPSITESYRDPVVTITKNYSEIPFDEIIEFLDTVNGDTFTFTYRGTVYVIQVGQAWLADIQHSGQYENGEAYEEITWVFKIRRDGWLRNVLDQGIDGFLGDDTSGANGAPPLVDEHGDPITVPVQLDGKGSAIGSPGAGTKAVFLRFQTKRTKIFSELPI